MLPPIPQGLIPVTVQQDPPKPRPATPPVAPTQAGAGSDGVALRQSATRKAGWKRNTAVASAARAARRTRGSDEGDEAPADEAGRAPRRTSRRARDN
ncbi:aspartate-semialdehyde dehydrogenase [Pseudomonas aeruginosa]|nr:aspartate-semialdehyde dehydrogenase [Pseudomonas aeruginosa]